MRPSRFSPPAVLAAFAFATALTLGGCSSSSGGGGGSTCTTDEQKACVCGSTTSGTQTCLDTGAFGECACPAADSGSGGDASSEGDGMCNNCGDGGGLADGEMRLDAAPGTFGAPCTTNADCASMDCNPFPAKGGSFCTQGCELASDCPAPALGCNGMGQCKVP